PPQDGGRARARARGLGHVHGERDRREDLLQDGRRAPRRLRPARGDLGREEVGRLRHGERRRPRRRVGRRAHGPRARALQRRRDARAGAARRGLPHARQPHEGAQEVRSARRAAPLPVLQALSDDSAPTPPAGGTVVAGHSHWSKIKRQKGATDAKKGKIFSKHARLIMTAARLGGGDPDMNARLRLAIDKAKADGMPKDNVERAVKKGAGETGGAAFEGVVYEGCLAGGVAILIDALTDNRTRTVASVRNVLERHGGNLASSGAVMWAFEQRALFRFAAAATTEERLMEVALEAGAEDLRAA